jgi:cysteinyl-tRNA synthetase
MAQAHAARNSYAQYWMHNGLVTYEGEKMSKSVGNTVSPEEMLALARPRVVRYYLGQAHYRSVLDYRPSSLDEAGAAVERIDGFLAKGQARFGAAAGVPADLPEAFGAAMDDDLNIPQALAVLHESVRAGNTALAAGDADGARSAYAAVAAMVEVLGLNDATDPGGAANVHQTAALDSLIRSQLHDREAARAAKDWARADAIRDALATAGILVEDSTEGAAWSLSAR